MRRNQNSNISSFLFGFIIGVIFGICWVFSAAQPEKNNNTPTDATIMDATPLDILIEDSTITDATIEDSNIITLDIEHYEYTRDLEVPNHIITNKEEYKAEALKKEIELENYIDSFYEHESYTYANASNVTSTPSVNYTQPSGDGVLTASKGVNYYGEQKETYYNLPMGGVIDIAKSQGIEGEYWVREDGCKMYGDYIIAAANLNTHPRGSLVETSLGTAIVLDTGGFATSNPTQVDIATSW